MITIMIEFADNLKLYRTIKNELDVQLLQDDIDKLSVWCTNNKLDLNAANKCAVVSYSRSHSNIATSYKLNGHNLQEVPDIKDLGIIIDSKHIDKITLEAFKDLGLITRTGKDFRNPYTLICLYRQLVLPILEYGTVVWSPHTDVSFNRLEEVQNKFCCQVADLVFYFKVANNLIDAPEILVSFEFAPTAFLLRQSRKPNKKDTEKLRLPGPHNRIANHVNSLHQNIDFYGSSLSSFINNIKVKLLPYH
ncbi:PREDICTED: uncharacterized protein LOC108976582 [Bactrocera latifrons]|uniref:uncharacterized protein LOC108976582 n=1 Tax=Bactrocera latifrons TaxID=174628 RepID=UPI0008DD76D8|nr:PREDICTED: uncharacterized protein LOC108976582 [Bactrocera latifrons]